MSAPSRSGVHPGGWWLWALGLAVVCARTTNPLLLGTAVAVAGYVVAACRTPWSPWGSAYSAFLKLGLVLIVFNVALRLVLGPGGDGGVLVQLPQIPLPHWLAGLHLGGPVHSGALLSAVYGATQVAAALACIGAANALASPSRLLKALPAALYEAGLIVTVAMTFAPEAVGALGRLRTARRLRGRPTSGLAGLRGLAIPLLEGGLDRSLSLAAAMDSRGYGRRGGASTAQRRTAAALTLIGMMAVAVGLYALLATNSPTGLRLPALGGGAILLAVGLVIAGRRTTRSRHRPDRFGARSGLVAAAGLVAAGGTFIGHGLHPSAQPPALPHLPLLATAAALIALTPALFAAYRVAP